MPNWKVILQSNKLELLLLLIAICSSLIAFLIPKESLYEQEENIISGRILKKKIDGDKLSITLQGKEKVALSYTMKTEEEKEWLKNHYYIGEELQAKGEFYEVSSPTIFYTFSYKEYLYYHHIYSSFKATSLEKIKDAKGIYLVRQWIENRINKISNSNYLKAFILGDTQELDTQEYRNIGISHLFAISGMHISFFVMGLDRLLSLLKRKKEPYISIILILYLWIVGWSASIMRAVFLHILNQINQKKNLGLSKRKLIMDLFLIFIIIDPFFVKDMGFLYSFLISFCLTYIKRPKNIFISLFKTSFVATLASILISGPNYYEISLLSFISNIIFVPYVTYILFPMSILAIIFTLFTPIYHLLIIMFEGLINCFAMIPIGKIILPKVPIFIYIIYAISLYMYLSKNQKKYLTGCLILLAIIRIVPYFDASTTMYYLDQTTPNMIQRISGIFERKPLISREI